VLLAHGNPSKLTLKANAQQAQFGAQCSWVRVIFLMPFPKKISKTEVMVLFGSYFSVILEH
jgi:hypothetical protein